MLIASRNSFAVKFPITAKNYVQSGLVAMWDGIENAGWKKHDANATVWKDLIGNRDLICTNVTWTDTMAVFSGNGSAFRNESESSAMFYANRTMETCFRTNGGRFNNQDVVNIGTRDAGALGWWRMCVSGYSDRIIVANGRNVSNCVMVVYNSDELILGKTFALSSNTSGITGAWWNGTAATTSGIEYRTTGTYGECIGAANQTARFFSGAVMCVRCYERQLTVDELLANYSVDKIRFNLP